MQHFRYQNLIQRGWPCFRTAQMRPAGNHFNRLPCTTHAHAFSPSASSVLDRVSVTTKWSTLEYSCGWSAEGGFCSHKVKPLQSLQMTGQRDFPARVLKHCTDGLQAKISVVVSVVWSATLTSGRRWGKHGCLPAGHKSKLSAARRNHVVGAFTFIRASTGAPQGCMLSLVILSVYTQHARRCFMMTTVV